MELLFSFQQISSIGWDLRYLTVLLNLVKEKNRAKRRPLLLAWEYASVLTVYRMTCTSQRAGTEEGTCPGWGQNQLLPEDFTALPVSMKPGPWPQTYLSVRTQEPQLNVRDYVSLCCIKFASGKHILHLLLSF